MTVKWNGKTVCRKNALVGRKNDVNLPIKWAHIIEEKLEDEVTYHYQEEELIKDMEKVRLGQKSDLFE
jgi:hypothetical protein